MRFETKPGGQGQVDWADFGKIAIDGVERKLTLFVMVLGWSRMRYAEFTLDATTPTLLPCQLNAFAYFGGYPREILFDNIKQVVLGRGPTPDKHTWNPLFLDFAKHHGFLPRLCQPYRARTLAWCSAVGPKVHGTTLVLVAYLVSPFRGTTFDAD